MPVPAESLARRSSVQRNSKSAPSQSGLADWLEDEEFIRRRTDDEAIATTLWSKLRTKFDHKRVIWDEDRFTVKMYDFLNEKNLEKASIEYEDLSKNSFEEFLYDFVNDEIKLSVVFRHNHYIFSWMNENFIRKQMEVALATKAQVVENRAVLRQILTTRVVWPKPYQGLALWCWTASLCQSMSYTVVWIRRTWPFGSWSQRTAGFR